MHFPQVFAVRMLFERTGHWMLFTPELQMIGNVNETMMDARDQWERYYGPIGHIKIISSMSCLTLKDAARAIETALATPTDSKQRASGEKE